MSFNPFEDIESFDNVADNKTIELIEITLLLENEKNQYRTKDEADIEAQNEELIASIEEYGILQPLLVRKMEDGTYKIISGHRRKLMCERLVEEGKAEFSKIPCIIDDQIIDEDDEQLKIIATNKNREKNTWEKIQEVNIMTEILVRKKENGEIKGGRMIEWVAKNLGMSKTTVDRLQKIDKGLEPELKQALKDGELKQSPAETLARMSKEDQKAVYEKTGGKVTQADIDEYEQEQHALKTSETSFMDEMGKPEKETTTTKPVDYYDKYGRLKADKYNRTQQYREFDETIEIKDERLLEGGFKLYLVQDKEDGLWRSSAARGFIEVGAGRWPHRDADNPKDSKLYPAFTTKADALQHAVTAMFWHCDSQQKQVIAELGYKESEKASKQPDTETSSVLEIEIAAAKYTMDVLMKSIDKCSKLKEIKEDEGNEQSAQSESAKVEYLGKVLGRVQQDLFEMTGNDMFKE